MDGLASLATTATARHAATVGAGKSQVLASPEMMHGYAVAKRRNMAGATSDATSVPIN